MNALYELSKVLLVIEVFFTCLGVGVFTKICIEATYNDYMYQIAFAIFSALVLLISGANKSAIRW